MAISRAGDNFRDWMQRKLDNQMKAILIGLEDLGNRCLKEMREPSKRGYKDRTANLRSSTGFVIVKDGKVIRSSGFSSETHEGNTGEEGAKKGEALATEVASTVGNEGLCLILVAGMNYAVYVERMGLNVLDSAKLLAKVEAKELIDDLTR